MSLPVTDNKSTTEATTIAESKAKRALFAVMLVVLFSSAGIALPYPVLAPIFLNEVKCADNLCKYP